MPDAAPDALLSQTDLESYLHASISNRDTASATFAINFAVALCQDVIGFDILTGVHDVSTNDITVVRGIAVRIAAQYFTNPEDRASYSGPEGLAYTPSTLIVSRLMSEADRRTLTGIADKYEPGFA